MRYSLIILFILACAACSPVNRPEDPTAGPLFVDTIPGQSPYLSKAANGHLLLSWIRMNNDSTFSYCFSTLNKGGRFGTPAQIPNTKNIQPHGENLPKIIKKPSGEIIALWGVANPNPKNKYSGLIYYVQSFDEGKNWTAPKPLVTDASSFDQRYYDVAILPGGEAGVIWLDNRNTEHDDGSNVYFATTKGKDGFGPGSIISKPACPCCRTVLYPDKQGNIHVLYRGIIQDSVRDMVHIVSQDGGKSFSTARRISNDNWVINACPHTGPAMTESSSGLHFTWFTGGAGKGCYYSYTKDNGKNFADRVDISAAGSHPQITTLANNNLMIVWDEFVQPAGNSCKKIGIQRIDENGRKMEKLFITPDTLTATYPVIEGLPDNSSIVAYTLKKQGKNYIAYQLVH